MPSAQAARVSDQVKHSEAQLFRRIGMGVGALVGIGIGVALVAASGALEVLSAGTATPIAALGIYVGATLVIGGTAAATGAAVSNSAADRGQDHLGDDEGPIITGEISIHVGPERHVAAHIGSKAACNKHKHTPPDDMEEIVQGSISVRLGRGKSHAARVGDKGTCGFIIGHGCPSVIIGGETVTVGKVGDGDDPEKALFNKIGEYGGYAALVGGAILAIPVAAAGGTLMVGLKAGAMALGKGVLFSQAISRGINLLPEGRLRDDANTVASFLPLLDHGGKAEGGEGGSEGGGSNEGSNEGSSGEGSGGGEGTGAGPEGNADAVAGAAPEPAPVPVRAPASGDAPPSDASAPANRTGGTETGESGGATEGNGAGESSGAGENPAEAPQPAGEADPTKPIGDSPGGSEGEAPPDDPASAGDGDAAPPETPPESEAGQEDNVYRKDRAPESPEGRKPGSRKSYLDENGDLHPANADGQATVQQHVRGAEPAKSDSPYTSFSDQLGTSKDYGGDLLTLDRGGLRQDIADGKVEGVEILDHEDVLNAHDGYISDAQARYDANPTPKNQERLDRAQQDRANSVRDREVLIKGDVPSKYITRTPEGGTPPEGPGGGGAPEGGGPAGGHDELSGGGGSPEGLGGKDAPPPADTTKGTPENDPLLQLGKRDGGMPGEAPPEEPNGGGPGGGTDGPAPAGGGDPTVPVGDSPGGRPDDSTGGDGDASDRSASADAKKWGVTWFNEAALKYVDSPDAVLGRPDGLAWFMPSEDAAGLHSVADVARETGMAPGAAEAYKTNGRMFGLSFPLDGVESRLPVAEDAGFNADGTPGPWANPNWLSGGHTAVRFGEPGEPGGGFLVNPTHEFVTPGGKPVPSGSVLFGLEPDGSWTPIRRF